MLFNDKFVKRIYYSWPYRVGGPNAKYVAATPPPPICERQPEVLERYVLIFF